MRKLRYKIRVSVLLKIVATVAFAGYCCWNAMWWCRGQLAPSIWSSVTGLPCPSSGIIRSISAAISGEYKDFILYNPFTLPFVLLFIFSAYSLARIRKKTHKFLLPPIVGSLWLFTLTAAWLAKFLIGKRYW